MCGNHFKRITKTHLKNKCVESITTEEYLSRFPDAELISSDLKKLYSNTEESIKQKWGNEQGKDRWENYVSAQAETNMLEHKKNKYGWTKEEFDEYNKSRAQTLDNMISRYGDEDGIVKWEEYCNRQRYTTTIEYFIDNYGSEIGIEKYNNFLEKRLSANKHQSKVELEAYNSLSNIIDCLQLSVKLDNAYYGPFDYGSLERKKLIEFYGTYWHADPRFYSSNFVCRQKNMSAKQIHSRDQAKRTYAMNQGYKVFIIWEHDWRKSKEKTINNIIKWWNE